MFLDTVWNNNNNKRIPSGGILSLFIAEILLYFKALTEFGVYGNLTATHEPFKTEVQS